MKKTCKYLLGIMTVIMLLGMTSFAAEVTPVNAVLFANEETVVYAEADLMSAVILPKVQEGIPIQVTGVTDNGFFQVNLGEIFYIPGYGLSEQTVGNVTVAQEENQAPKGVPQEIYDVKQSYNEYIVCVVELVNKERQNAGLSPLAYDEQITYAATQRSYEMAAYNYFEHARPDGTSCFTVMKEYGVPYWMVGENIASGQRTPEKVMSDWMNSPGHRANILTPDFTKIGVGIAADAKGHLYWTQLFVS